MLSLSIPFSVTWLLSGTSEKLILVYFTACRRAKLL